MGSRTLKRWLALPLKKIEKIEQRHEVVAYLLSHTDTLSLIKDNISRMGDIERLISKVATLKINPREVVQLCASLEHIAPIKQQCLQSGKESLSLLGDKLHDCLQLCTRIRETLTDEAPVNIDSSWLFGRIRRTAQPFAYRQIVLRRPTATRNPAHGYPFTKNRQ